MNESPARDAETENTAKAPRRDLLWALIFFGIALIPRVIGLTWGLPNARRWYSYHPDESGWQAAGAVFNMVSRGDLNPHFFNYPSLTIYATYFNFLLMSALGLTTPGHGGWESLHDIILAGRIFSALCGAATAAVVYLLARRFTEVRPAAVAALCAALAPGLLQHSHFATVDVPATFSVALCLFLTARAREPRHLLGAAAVAGLATGAKYNAILVLAAPIVALWLMPGSTSKRLIWSVGFIALALALFLVTTPYALLDFREFWGSGENGFAYELLRHPREGSGDLFTNTGNGWWYHLTFNLPFAASWPLLLAGLAGMILGARDRRLWPALAFAVLFFGSLGTSQVRFMRYVLPLLPVLCLGVGIISTQSRLPRVLRVGSSCLALLGVITSVPDVVVPFVQVDPRDQAVVALRNRKVAISGTPWFFTPPFQPLGFNRPVPGVPSVGTSIEKLESLRPVGFTICEFEWREQLRQQPGGDMSRFLDALDREAQEGRATREVFGGRSRIPFGLQRAFKPTDYRYTNPEVRVYSLR